TKQYADSEKISMLDHTMSQLTTSSERSTVLPINRHTDFESETVGTSEPQPLEKSVLCTEHTEHTVLHGDIKNKLADVCASPADLPTVSDWVWLLSADGVQQNATPYQIREIALGSDGALYARFIETTTGWPLAQCERTALPSSAPPLSDRP